MNKSVKQTKSKNSKVPNGEIQGTRETIESFVVAIILAFLFKTFIAEAFVIPTGSMAPTLMGAHKDLYCAQCNFNFQSGASSEFDELGRKTKDVVTGAICPICRAPTYLDLKNNPNDRTFNGDRILVSKFDYAFGSPDRWDVIVFKFPGDARMNYIKRLIGLPNEKILINHGDIYIKKGDADQYQIARKPPRKILATLQPVADTDYLAPDLVKAGWPSNWQPWSLGASEVPTNGWTVSQTPESWKAEFKPNTAKESVALELDDIEAAAIPFPKEIAWLRYYHRFPDGLQWPLFLAGEAIAMPHPYESTLITDFAAYNASMTTDRASVYRDKGFNPKYVGGVPLDGAPMADQAGNAIVFSIDNEGLHWVSDLCFEADLKVESNEGEVWLTLVESGIHFSCKIDVSTGIATLSGSFDGRNVPIADTPESATVTTAQTSLKGAGSYDLRMANVDDQIVLWINGTAVSFDHSAEDAAVPFAIKSFRNESDDRPHWKNSDPLDAAPLGIGGRGVAMQVNSLKVFRDIYYIAFARNIGSNVYCDFLLNGDGMLASFKNPETRQMFMEQKRASKINSYDFALFILPTIYASPEEWSQTDLFERRNSLTYELAEDQFFPMGDNSAASSDARAWSLDSRKPSPSYVERDLMIGKALLVFWPHTWARPIPFLPNFKRMGLIR